MSFNSFEGRISLSWPFEKVQEWGWGGWRDLVLGKNRILSVGYSWRQLCCLFFTCTFLFFPQLHSLSFSSLICTPGEHSLIPCHLTSSWVLPMRGGQDGGVGGETGCGVSSFAHSLHWRCFASRGISPWFQLLKIPLCASSSSWVLEGFTLFSALVLSGLGEVMAFPAIKNSFPIMKDNS